MQAIKVLVTGCNGLVGRCLVTQMQTMSSITLCALERERLDITNREQVYTVVNQFHPDVIINAAAYTAVDKAEQEIELCYAINRDGPKYLAEAANQVGALILHISSDYVFSGRKHGLYTEDDIPDPLGVYGQSKLAGEIEVANLCPRHIILRTAWVFGEHGKNFVNTMLGLTQTHDELGVVADQFGGPTYAADIAASLITITKAIRLKNGANFGIYHYSGEPHVSWHQFAEYIFEQAFDVGLINKEIRVNAITTTDYPTQATRPANSKLDCRKIMKQFGIAPSDWQAALKNLNQW